MKMLKRELYLKRIREFYDSDLIKIITGIRRCGKSVILKTVCDEINCITSNTIYLDFEDAADLKKAGSVDSLLNYIEQNKEDGKCYIFLDEIQNIKDWPIAVRTLRLQNNSVFISGSNSKLLSSELATLLSGRYVSFNLAPFSFKEVVQYKNLSNRRDIEDAFNDYLLWGGMPQRFEFKTIDGMKTYLMDVFDAIVLKDIVKRHNIKNISLFERIMKYLITNPSQFFSPSKMIGEFDRAKIPVSTRTVYECLDYAKEAFLMNRVVSYDVRGKRILSRNDKYYLTDLGLGQILNVNKKTQFGAYLENIVYNELIYRGYNVSVGNNNGKEIDFVATKHNLIEYYQVAYSLENKDTEEREFGAYKNIDDNYPKYVISNDKLDYSQNGIIHKNIIDFLLEK